LSACPWASCRNPWREVPIVTNINSGVLPVQWPSRPGASCLRVSVPGTGVLGARPSAAVARAVPRVRNKVALTVPAAQSGHTNIHNFMTSAYAVGGGASGPPHRREPA